jgi:hypothetical protein
LARSPSTPGTTSTPDGGAAQVGETTLGSDRLVVRRTRLLGP